MKLLPNVYQDKLNADHRNPLKSLGAHKDVSAKYKFQSSTELINRICLHGFKLESTSYAEVYKPEKSGFQKHIMIFTNDDLRIDDENQIQLLVTNSHDRTSSLKFNLGIYRTVCANGLVVGETFFSDRIIHVGKDQFEDKLVAILDKFVKKAPEVVSMVRQMKLITMSDRLASRFALDCAFESLRQNEGVTIDVMSILKRHRQADMSTDLWTIYNVVQENIVRGKFKYQKPNKEGVNVLKKATRVKSLDRTRVVNQMIFDKAQVFLNVA